MMKISKNVDTKRLNGRDKYYSFYTAEDHFSDTMHNSVNYHGETYNGSTFSNWRLNERIHRERTQSGKASSMHRANPNQQQPRFKTQCGQCQSLASKSSKLQEDLETKKVLLAEKEDQIADLLAGIDE